MSETGAQTMCNHRSTEHRSAECPGSHLLLPLAVPREAIASISGHQLPGGEPTAQGPASALSTLGRQLLPNLGLPVPADVPLPVHVGLRKAQLCFAIVMGL